MHQDCPRIAPGLRCARLRIAPGLPRDCPGIANSPGMRFFPGTARSRTHPVSVSHMIYCICMHMHMPQIIYGHVTRACAAATTARRPVRYVPPVLWQCVHHPFMSSEVGMRRASCVRLHLRHLCQRCSTTHNTHLRARGAQLLLAVRAECGASTLINTRWTAAAQPH